MLELRVYSRRGCHLCELLLEELAPLCRERAVIQVLDVDTREEWRLQFGDRVPVLVWQDREICAARLDREALAGLFAGPPA